MKNIVFENRPALTDFLEFCVNQEDTAINSCVCDLESAIVNLCGFIDLVPSEKDKLIKIIATLASVNTSLSEVEKENRPFFKEEMND